MIFVVEEWPEGGFSARAVGEIITATSRYHPGARSRRQSADQDHRHRRAERDAGPRLLFRDAAGERIGALYVPKGIHQSQPKQRKPVQTRLEDILPGRNPSAMFAEHLEARQQREEALRGS